MRDMNELRMAVIRARLRKPKASGKVPVLPFGATESLINGVRAGKILACAREKGAFQTLASARVERKAPDNRPKSAVFEREDGMRVAVFGRDAVEFLRNQCAR